VHGREARRPVASRLATLLASRAARRRWFDMHSSTMALDVGSRQSLDLAGGHFLSPAARLNGRPADEPGERARTWCQTPSTRRKIDRGQWWCTNGFL